MAGTLKKAEMIYSHDSLMGESTKFNLLKIMIACLGVISFLFFTKMALDILDEGNLRGGLHSIGLVLHEWAGAFIAE